MFSSLSC